MAKVILTSLKTKTFSDNDIGNAVERAISLLDFNFKSDIHNVVIKPNLSYYWNSSTGETTDPRVVCAVIDCIRRKLGKDIDISIVEADASAMKTKYSFKVLGYDKLCQAKNVKLENLSEGDIVDMKVTVKGKEIVLPINQLLLKADLRINIPKLKTHNFIGATCAMKNMFGAISKPRKYAYHGIISHVIAAVNKIVKSDIVIVDGLVVRGSCPRKLGAILVSDDPVATDFIAAKIMGFNPKKISYLNLAEKEQIGEVKDIELIEEDIRLREIKRNFPRYNHLIHRISWSLQFKMLKAYMVVTGDVLPPILENS